MKGCPMNSTVMNAKKANVYMFVILSINIALQLVFSVYVLLTGKTDLSPFVSVLPLQAFSLTLPLLVYKFAFRKKWGEIIPLKNPGAVNVVYAVLIGIFIQPVMMVISGLTSLLFPNNVGDVIQEMNGINIFLSLFILAVIPGVNEELTMRGVLLTGYRNAGIIKTALVSGLFFAMFHMNPPQFFYSFALGFVFAVMVRVTGSVPVSVIPHFIINACQTLLVYCLPYIEKFAAALETEFEAIESDSAAGDLSLILTALIILFLFLIVFPALFILFFTLFIRRNRKAPVNPAAGTGTEACLKPEKEKILNWAFWLVICRPVIFIILLAIIVFVLMSFGLFPAFHW